MKDWIRKDMSLYNLRNVVQVELDKHTVILRYADIHSVYLSYTGVEEAKGVFDALIYRLCVIDDEEDL